MLSNNERLDALVQQLSILAGLNYVQSAHMTYQAVSKGMVTEVLTILISIVLFVFGVCSKVRRKVLLSGLSQPYLLSFMMETP